ncbi:MAG TPA: 30S ribosomal protein S17 [Gammaproteobacteria bacterium]|nr:30S ribosomal protein S17 [Gammaproteobacteria bacterium]
MTIEQTEQKNNPLRTVIGKVVSDKMDKTIVVQVERKVQHPLYGKYVRRFSKMYAHDEENACRLGDMVLIKQSRPLSKTKRWMLVEIIKREE